MIIGIRIAIGVAISEVHCCERMQQSMFTLNNVESKQDMRRTYIDVELNHMCVR